MADEPPEPSLTEGEDGGRARPDKTLAKPPLPSVGPKSGRAVPLGPVCFRLPRPPAAARAWFLHLVRLTRQGPVHLPRVPMDAEGDLLSAVIDLSTLGLTSKDWLRFQLRNEKGQPLGDPVWLAAIEGTLLKRLVALEAEAARQTEAAARQAMRLVAAEAYVDCGAYGDARRLYTLLAREACSDRDQRTFDRAAGHLASLIRKKGLE